MRYQSPGILTAMLILLLAVAAEDLSQAAPRRPSNSSGPCSISADKFNQLAAKNPSGAQACKSMEANAQAHGGSFAFMCDAATGEISCCNDSSCVSLGTAMKGKFPGLRPQQFQGTLQQVPGTQGGKPGVAPPGGTAPLQTR
ncbi:MAG: hypothetical protein QM771_10790 [Nitrospira sp.]